MKTSTLPFLDTNEGFVTCFCFVDENPSRGEKGIPRRWGSMDLEYCQPVSCGFLDASFLL